MEALKFKTTIKCSGCVANVTPVLDKLAGKNNWQVNINLPEKILSIDNAENLDEHELVNAITLAGYKAEKIS